MGQLDTGLRHRVERIVRQIGNQHRSLKVLYDDLTTAFGREGRSRVSDLCRYYAEAVCAHFSLEEACLFPACKGMDSEVESDLAALCLEHSFFIDELEKLRDRVFTENAADGKRALDALYAAIAAHEKREERLVRGLLAAHDVPAGPPRDLKVTSRI